MKRKHQPIVGVTYGFLTYISEAARIVRPSKTLRAGNFVCICGKEVIQGFQEVCIGQVTSCGCMRGKSGVADITNKKFDRLTALRRTENKQTGGYLWECICDCGTQRLSNCRGFKFGTGKVLWLLASRH